MELLYFSLDTNEFGPCFYIQECQIKKFIQHKVIVTYDGTNQVHKTKNYLFIKRQYQHFKKTGRETMKQSFIRCTKIMNKLDPFGKTLMNEQKS